MEAKTNVSSFQPISLQGACIAKFDCRVLDDILILAVDLVECMMSVRCQFYVLIMGVDTRISCVRQIIRFSETDVSNPLNRGDNSPADR